MTDRVLHLPLLDGSFPLPVDRPFTFGQAVAAGVSRHRLRRLEEEALVRRVLKGVYVAAQVPDSLTLRTRALRLVVPRDAVVTDWTACWFHTGVLRAGQHVEVPPLSVFRPAGHDRLRNTLCASGERGFALGDLTHVGGLRVTTPLRTAWDLGRLAHRDRAIGALDALLRHGSFTRGELVAGVERFTGMRGVVQLRALAPLADARAESPGESTLRLRWLDLPSLPPPTPQVSITVGAVEVYRVDLGVPELRYGCEYDGEEFHGAAHEAHDLRRRADLRGRFGWDVDAVRKRDVSGPTRDVERVLVEGIRRARRAGGGSTYLG
ncbi:type IV toxin-antitoxin system AbiEi family antitoxin domain-containing protein [Nocardioides panacis]|uniref:Type IV toxin-antitoxin system AbiEi family antitoxin domain-containing protein n=1 Tax=Nocardioides panacis TaxID=2849501 RepID=A0A975SW58_9ACTN|nr:type IV toxin-antitoxin system AbiEi family antitoxin domain-containing protein [Nocardioides panacis]QWZ07030.1 type IV toxin-antitoxin system AbiEi family antitoxin domain-containing protein [Nocardioides panacis]